MRPAPTAAAVLAGGLMVGILTAVAQGPLHGEWNALANSGAVWLLPAFFVGSFMPNDRWAAWAGIGMLVGAVVGYYASVPLIVADASWSSRSVAIWAGAAIVAGSVYGVAGRWWRSRGTRARVLALGLLGGAFLAEGVSRLVQIHDRPAGWAMVAAGCLLPLVLGRSNTERLLGILVTVPVALLTIGAYGVSNLVFLRA